MIVLCAGMNKINNELRRTQYELTLPEHFAFFASFAVHNFIHRKGRKDSLIGLYAINHRGHREHREKWQRFAIPVTTYETAAASRFRTRMTRIRRIFTDIFDSCASLFHSPDNKPQRSQSRIAKLCALRVLCGGLTLFTSWITRIFTNPCASVSSVLSVFYCHTSAFICVHLRLISVSLSDRAQKIKFELFTMMKKLPISSCFLKQNIIKCPWGGEA